MATRLRQGAAKRSGNRSGAAPPGAQLPISRPPCRPVAHRISRCSSRRWAIRDASRTEAATKIPAVSVASCSARSRSSHEGVRSSDHGRFQKRSVRRRKSKTDAGAGIDCGAFADRERPSAFRGYSAVGSARGQCAPTSAHELVGVVELTFEMYALATDERGGGSGGRVDPTG